MIEAPCQTLCIPFSCLPGDKHSLQLGVYHSHVCFYFHITCAIHIHTQYKHINGIKHIFYNFLFVTDNFLHLRATAIKWNCWICSASLSSERNSSVTGLNLSPNAPAYSVVCPFLLPGNETGNWNSHLSTQRQGYSSKPTSPKVQFYHVKSTGLKSFPQASTKEW